MTIYEIKIRRIENQYLISQGEIMTVVRDLCGVQAQFMVNALHSLKIRCADFCEDRVKNGFVKNWTVRGTIHVFAQDDLPLFLHCNNGADYRKNEWRGYTFWGQRDCWALTPDRQKFFADIILEAVEKKPCTRDELKEICRSRGMTEPEQDSMFDQWGGGIRELCERGFMNYVVQEKKTYCAAPRFTPIPEDQANLEIARRYFTHFGPATIHDAQYYFHTTAAQVKKWLSGLPVQFCECNGRTYYYIENGRKYARELPKCLFLAGFDQLMLGYEKKENPYLPPENIRGIFNLAGIVMPALMIDGRVVGRWKKKGGKLTIILFENLHETDIKAICEKSESFWGNAVKIEFM